MTWTTVANRTIAMTSNVYIGMAVCSHNSAVTELSVFSNVQTAPPTITAESISDTTATFYWPALVPSASYYVLYRNNTAIATLSGTTFSYDDVQLTPSTSYTYYVKAAGSNTNETATSSSVTFTTSAPLLPSPWSHQDISNPGAISLGGYSQENSTTQVYSLVGSGAGVGSTADSFQYAWQPFSGDDN